ncbi:hypothetical protein [Novosphingobium sp.]|uniref:hypothetical protein n=1 Tax=Novosphingobium sp. TaxID=1874826 RepID=UPI003341F2B8
MKNSYLSTISVISGEPGCAIAPTVGLSREVIHDLKQPINAIQLTAGSIGLRLLPHMAGGDAAYLRRKLLAIEAQIALLCTRLDKVSAERPDSADAGAATQPDRVGPGECTD